MTKADVARRRALAYAFATASGLGALVVAVGQLGLDGALQLCETRKPPPLVRHLWESLGYGISQLPTREEVEQIIVAVDYRRRQALARVHGKPKDAPGVSAGLNMRDVRRGERLLDSYGAKVDPLTTVNLAKGQVNVSRGLGVI